MEQDLAILNAGESGKMTEFVQRSGFKDSNRLQAQPTAKFEDNNNQHSEINKVIHFSSRTNANLANQQLQQNNLNQQ